MNEEQNKSKTAVIKSLAIIGFIATIILAVWLSIQVVRVIPDAFSSLASIADSIDKYSTDEMDTLTIATGKSIVNAGESFTISWTNLNQPGSYTFTYTCTDGVSIELRSGNGEITRASCAVPVAFGADVQTLDIIVSSERKRFIDVPFSLTFTSEETQEKTVGSSKFTVVNATIPQSATVASNESGTTEDTSEPVEDTDSTVGTPTTRVAGAPVTTTETVTFFPTSHADGFTDLKVTYLGVGTIANDVFEPKATIDNDSRGAIRFQVKNIGTKTSEGWTFTAQLPNGSDYTSNEQAALRPNERAVLTLGFTLNDNETGSKAIEIEIAAPNDTKNSNDSFTWSVQVTE